MAVKLRLQRIGKKKQPLYKIVAIDSRRKRNGRFIDAVGSYNPRTNPMTITLREDRVFHWLERGAQPTDTVKNLLSRKGVWLKWGLKKKKADDATIAAEFEKWQMTQTLKLQKENERKMRRNAVKKKKKEAASEAPAQPAAAAPEAPAPAQP
ncbi:MAG TPA: 30S ribosomal protein S16 [Bacteroidota bacterium]|nr:30S ribosomal protein S16 [Bacteroidota bacterium]